MIYKIQKIAQVKQIEGKENEYADLENLTKRQKYYERKNKIKEKNEDIKKDIENDNDKNDYSDSDKNDNSDSDKNY